MSIALTESLSSERILEEIVRYLELKAIMEEKTLIIFYERGFIFYKTVGKVSLSKEKHFYMIYIDMYTPDW